MEENSSVVRKLPYFPPRIVPYAAVVMEFPRQGEAASDSSESASSESEPEQDPQEAPIDATVLENITNNLHRFDPRNYQHPRKCSIFVAPPDVRGWDEEAYRPKVVLIGPKQHRSATISKYLHDYKDMENCKSLILRHFISRRVGLNEPERTSSLINRCLLELKKHEEKIRRYYSYEIEPQSDDLATIMMLDGCFLLYLLLDSHTPEVVGRVWIWTLVRYDLLLLENQIPFFVIYELRKILGTRDEMSVDLVQKALELFRDAHPLRENSTFFFEHTGNRSLTSVFKEKRKNIFHLLHLFYLSLLPDSSSSSMSRESSASAQVWIPCASELAEYGVKFRKKTSATSFLDISFTRRGVMEIPPILIDDHSKNLLRNLIVFEQCYGNTECHITVYSNFMECIISNDKDVRLLSLNNVVTNRMSADQNLTLFFSSLCKGIHFAKNRYYLANVTTNVTDYKNNKWKKGWADFKRYYCSSIWVVIAVVVSVVIFVATVVQAVYGVLSYDKG